MDPRIGTGRWPNAGSHWQRSRVSSAIRLAQHCIVQLPSVSKLSVRAKHILRSSSRARFKVGTLEVRICSVAALTSLNVPSPTAARALRNWSVSNMYRSARCSCNCKRSPRKPCLTIQTGHRMHSSGIKACSPCSSVDQVQHPEPRAPGHGLLKYVIGIRASTC